MRFKLLVVKRSPLGAQPRTYESSWVSIDDYVHNVKPLIDHYLGIEDLICCDIIGGFFIDVDGERWIGYADEFWCTTSWFSGLEKILKACPRLEGKFYREEADLELGFEDLFLPRIFGSYFSIVEESKKSVALKHISKIVDDEVTWDTLVLIDRPKDEIEKLGRIEFDRTIPGGMLDVSMDDETLWFYKDETWTIKAFDVDIMGIKGFGSPEEVTTVGFVTEIHVWEESEMTLEYYQNELLIKDQRLIPYWVPFDRFAEGMIRESHKLAVVCEELRSTVSKMLQEGNRPEDGDDESRRREKLKLLLNHYPDGMVEYVNGLDSRYEKWKNSSV